MLIVTCYKVMLKRLGMCGAYKYIADLPLSSIEIVIEYLYIPAFELFQVIRASQAFHWHCCLTLAEHYFAYM
jgi:hypothetical protein